VVREPIGALAHLQLASAYVLAGDKRKARTAHQAFLTLSKDAEADIHSLKVAREEYAELQVKSRDCRFLEPQGQLRRVQREESQSLGFRGHLTVCAGCPPTDAGVLAFREDRRQCEPMP
jgi:hypothetical protein